MRTTHFRTLVIGTLALMSVAGGAAAQTSSTVLNTLEVQELVKRAAPDDHARLGAHFGALAEQYTAEARRHTAMAQAFIESPIRRVAANAAADHCKRLATLRTQAADTVRELAAHHERLAAGAPSTAPRSSAPFERGAGASVPAEQDLTALAAKASTPADHRALDEYFLTLAKRYTTDANEHATLAQAYRGTGNVSAAAHCDRLVTLSRDSAREANAAAAMHKGLAGAAQ